MAGWSKRVDGSGLESRFRPFPPMLGDGNKVDLYKLYCAVREKGGYQRVCGSGCWGVVAKECGFDSASGLALKLVYVKYLDPLDRVMGQMDLELDLKEVLMRISDEKKKDEEYPNINGNVAGLNRRSKDFVGKHSDIDEKISTIVYNKEDSEFVKQNGDGVGLVDLSGVKEDYGTRKRKYSEEEQLKFVNGNGDVKCGSDNVRVERVSGDVKDDIARKRNRGSYLEMLKWVTEVAKDPCDPAIEHLPERYKWKSYGNELVWKKVLSLREEMLLERNLDTSTQLSVWQQKQKMHPSMYDDNTGSERLRCSQRVLSAKDPMKKTRHFLTSSSSGSHIELTLVDGPIDSSVESGAWWNRRRKKAVPIGSEFQADIPEWKSDIYECESKWLGTQIWPLDKKEERRLLIERDPAGKGRQDTCGCESPGSYDCIRFHLFEKTRKVKCELGSAFDHWKFDSIGEKVALSWTKEDQRKFQDIVKLRPLSEDESFTYWTELFKSFPHKSRESLVSYYFNVFLLRRRGEQNRINTSDIDSDDDESGCGPRFNCFGHSPSCVPQRKHI